ncbi:MAG: hypothetical protein ACR2QJ_00515, partial [Geminicoccaceae bacterium]
VRRVKAAMAVVANVVIAVRGASAGPVDYPSTPSTFRLTRPQLGPTMVRACGLLSSQDMGPIC